MRHALHAVFNQELESIPVLIHVEISCTNFSYDMLDITYCRKLLTFFKLENDLFEMVVTRKHGHNYFVWLIFSKLQDLLNEFNRGKLDLVGDGALRFEGNGLDTFCSQLLG